jgi:hypothetical protein
LRAAPVYRTVDDGGPMTHRLDRCDILDILEESIVMRTPVVVVLANDHTFEDRVKDIVAQDGEDHIVFAVHGTTPLRKIATARRA